MEKAAELLLVDPQHKDEPGDLVVVWRKKRGPLVTRHIARHTPFSTF